MARRSRKKKQPAATASLPDDLLLEILARVPYRSLCRFKCVSQSWRALCSDHDLRKRSPQTLSGFFCHARDSRVRFVNLSGKGRPLVDPELLFLRDLAAFGIILVDCCSSLLLCKCFKTYFDADWVVCNPATQKWTVLPATEALHCSNTFTIRLGFDPATPTRFQAFVLKQDAYIDGRITGVEIYSLETGRWISIKSEWGRETCVHLVDSQFAFFNGTLHFTTFHSSARDDSFCPKDSTCECD
ncbi:F-box protein At5g07610 [Lolium perenne]|uniref:F-box protein At5g07610 n=1 Tax=Lolium perenne TaxID=4522 RepID=UPI0021F61930|nr:F-box protein At5g07610-like [Lolium perenne]